MPLKAIQSEMITRFMGLLMDAGLSDKYRKTVYNLLNLLFDLAYMQDFIVKSPIRARLHRPKVVRREKPTFPMEKLREFLEALPEPWRAPIAVVMLTGMRQGELLGLRWKNVDFERRLLRLTHVVYRGQLQEGLKTRSEHQVGLSDPLLHILSRQRERSPFSAETDFVFCREDGSLSIQIT